MSSVGLCTFHATLFSNLCVFSGEISSCLISGFNITNLSHHQTYQIKMRFPSSACRNLNRTTFQSTYFIPMLLTQHHSRWLLKINKKVFLMCFPYRQHNQHLLWPWKRSNVVDETQSNVIFDLKSHGDFMENWNPLTILLIVFRGRLTFFRVCEDFTD